MAATFAPQEATEDRVVASAAGPALAVAMAKLLLDPSSYDVLGLRGTAGSDIDLGDTVIHPGTVWYEFAQLDHRLVDEAGDTA